MPMRGWTVTRNDLKRVTWVNVDLGVLCHNIYTCRSYISVNECSSAAPLNLSCQKFWPFMCLFLFGFESCNGDLKRLFHGTKNMSNQVLDNIFAWDKVILYVCIHNHWWRTIRVMLLLGSLQLHCDSVFTKTWRGWRYVTNGQRTNEGTDSNTVSITDLQYSYTIAGRSIGAKFGGLHASTATLKSMHQISYTHHAYIIIMHSVTVLQLWPR